VTIADLPEKQHAAMEALWGEEIGGPIARAQVSTLKALIRRGLVEVNKVDAPGNMVINVYRLTLAGHLAYCVWAATQPNEEEVTHSV
jgi:hypothetical protein